MKKLDKKQIPQFIALCVLSAGVFGYFILHLVMPSPVAAGTRPQPAAPAAQNSPAAQTSPAGAAKKSGAVAQTASATEEAPAPTAGMRDPFVAAALAPATPAVPAGAPGVPAAASALPKPGRQVVAIRAVRPAPIASPFPLGLRGFSAPSLPAAPPAPSLPPAARFAALRPAPVVFAPPAWTVTGVLQNETEKVAILRNGESRRIVRAGDLVDSVYRVVAVSRSSVVVCHGTSFYRLLLGTSTPTPTHAVPATLPHPKAPLPEAAPPAMPVSEPKDTALTPRQPVAQVQSPPVKAALVPTVSAQKHPAAMISHRVAPIRFAMQSHAKQSPVKQSPVRAHANARALLQQGRDLYQLGLRPEGRAEWSQALTAGDPAAVNEAEKLLRRYP